MISLLLQYLFLFAARATKGASPFLQDILHLGIEEYLSGGRHHAFSDSII